MRQFLDENFLLENNTGIKLFNEFSRNMPIFDFHCHLSPKDIAENKSFKNITELWLYEDHYKWRLIRSNGVDEKYVTGDASDKEKFLKWAETLPYCIGNQLYHWTHLELQRYFGIYEPLTPETAESIWERCNSILLTGKITVRNLLKDNNVKAICTTDDPVDTLVYHKSIFEQKEFDTKVLPTFRPDSGINIEMKGFPEWIAKLGNVVGNKIESFDNLKKALCSRMDYFHQAGCRVSDHGLEPALFFEDSSYDIETIFKKGLTAKSLSQAEIEIYKTQMMIFLGKEYHRRGWAMQLHIGVYRNPNQRMFEKLGPNSGFDTIADWKTSAPVLKLLSKLDYSDELPKTVLYCINPSDNEVIGSMSCCFQSSGIPSKIQFGSAWWFNDNKQGIERQLTALANLGLFGRFIGMLTDSRSFLSFSRHEYFRRILCNLVGEWAEKGEVPYDLDFLSKLVCDISYTNAEKYFGVFKSS